MKSADAERQAHLMAYAIAWLRDNARSREDLLRFETLSRLWATLRTDFVAVLVRLGVAVGPAEDLVAEAAGRMVGDWAAKAVKGVGQGLVERIRTGHKRR